MNTKRNFGLIDSTCIKIILCFGSVFGVTDHSTIIYSRFVLVEDLASPLVTRFWGGDL